MPAPAGVPSPLTDARLGEAFLHGTANLFICQGSQGYRTKEAMGAWLCCGAGGDDAGGDGSNYRFEAGLKAILCLITHEAGKR